MIKAVVGFSVHKFVDNFIYIYEFNWLSICLRCITDFILFLEAMIGSAMLVETTAKELTTYAN